MDSSVGIATRYGLQGPAIEFQWVTRYSTPVQSGPGAHPASYTVVTWSLPGVKGVRTLCRPPTPFSPQVKERVELYLYSPSWPSWPVLGRTLPLPLPLLSFPGSTCPFYYVFCLWIFLSGLSTSGFVTRIFDSYKISLMRYAHFTPFVVTVLPMF